MEETDIQELLHSHAAELPEKDFEHLTVLSDPDDNKDYAAVVEASRYYPVFKKMAPRWQMNLLIISFAGI